MPAHDLHAEAAVLGSVLVDNTQLEAVSAELEERDFFRDVNRTIFRAMLALHQHGTPIDLVSLRQRLAESGNLDAVGGAAYLAGLTDEATAAYATHYAQIVRRLAALNRLEVAGKRISQLAKSADPDTDYATLEQQVLEMISSTQPKQHHDAAKATRSAKEIMALDLQPPKYAVPGVIPEGLTLFVGKPKLGKSWLVLSLALAVAAGGRAMGKLEVQAGSVLYLALEDGQRRLQSRLERLLNGAEPPDALEFRTDLPRLDEGGVREIIAWLDAHPDARMVLVDTLARVKPKAQKNASMYDADSDALKPLQRVSLERGVAVVIVHHTRKNDAGDVFDAVNGSTGLAGVADATLVLRRARGETNATLSVTGRDIVERDLALEFDPVLCTWALIGDAEMRVSPERRVYLDALAHGPLAPKDLAERIGKAPATARKMLFDLRDAGLVRRLSDGQYESVTPVTPAENTVQHTDKGITGPPVTPREPCNAVTPLPRPEALPLPSVTQATVTPERLSGTQKTNGVTAITSRTRGTL